MERLVFLALRSKRGKKTKDEGREGEIDGMIILQVVTGGLCRLMGPMCRF
jgi:hypothetical protein